MNGKKLKQLFASARNESAPLPPADFASDIMRAVRQEPPPMPVGPFSVWEHLNGLFPRLALAAAAVIILCAAADWGLTAAGLPEVGDGTTQVASQYLFNSESRPSRTRRGCSP
jgi:hypothetical protein